MNAAYVREYSVHAVPLPLPSRLSDAAVPTSTSAQTVSCLTARVRLRVVMRVLGARRPTTFQQPHVLRCALRAARRLIRRMPPKWSGLGRWMLDSS